MKTAILLTALATLALAAGCATSSSPEAAAAVATVCAMHKDASTVAAVNETAGLSAKEAAEKKLALDIYCATQAAAASAPK